MIDPPWSRSERISLHEWIKRYLVLIAESGIAQKTIQNKTAITSRLSAELGGHALHKITPKSLLNFINGFRARGNYSASQTAYIVLTEIFNEAWLDGWIQYSPMIPLKFPRNTVRRSRLDPQTWLAIRNAAERSKRNYLSHAMDIAISTAQRRGDIVKMRRCDIFDGHIHIEQQKTGYKLAIPLSLYCPLINKSVGQVIEGCPGGDYLLSHQQVRAYSLSDGFKIARDTIFSDNWVHPPSFHEQRSLAERIYRDFGIDTQRLLGHKRQQMTDKYNDNRGSDWNYVKPPQLAQLHVNSCVNEVSLLPCNSGPEPVACRISGKEFISGTAC